MPGQEKLDFGQALISGYDSKSITDFATNSNAEVVIQDPETYKSMGLNDDQIGIVNQQYDAYKRGEYVANQNVRYGTHSRFAELTHPQAMAITRSPLLRPGGLQRSAPAGYDIYGRQFATEQEMADKTGQFVNSDGQWENIGGEFWSWLGKAGMGILDLGNTAYNIAGGWAVNEMLDASGIKTTSELMDGLHSYAESKVINYDPYGNPYWQVFNPYENPKSAGDKTKVWWDGFFTNEQAQQMNKGLIMNPKGYMRSLYGAQPYESRTGLGNFARGIVDTIDTAIPTITGGVTGFAGNIQSLITGAPEDDWSYLKSVSRSAFLRVDQTKHPKSYLSQFKPWYAGENLGTGIGEVVGQLALMAATGGISSAAGFSTKAAGNISRGVFSLFAAGSWQDTMNDMGMDPKEAAVLYPIFAATTFAVETLIPGNIVESGLFKSTAKGTFRTMGTDVLKQAYKEGLESYGAKLFSDLTKTQKVKFAKDMAKSYSKQMLSTNSIVGRMLSTGYEEAREEVIEQLLNDVTTNFHDYFAAVENDIYEHSGLDGEYLNPTFKPYDTDRTIAGNFLANFDMDQYGQSFVLGFFGGLSGGVMHGGNKSKQNEAWMIDQVSKYKEKELYKILDKTDLMLDYTHTDGKRILNEKDKVEGAKSMNDFAKDKIRQDIEKLVEIRDKTGLSQAKDLGLFGGDNSIFAEAMKKALVISKLNQKIADIESNPDATEEDKTLIEKWKKDADDLSKDLKTNYLDEEVKSEIPGKKNTSKAYNNKIKHALALKEYAEEIVTEKETKANIDVAKMTSEEKKKHNEDTINTMKALRLQEIFEKENMYQKTKKFNTVLADKKTDTTNAYEERINNATSGIENLFKDINSKVDQVRERIGKLTSITDTDKLREEKDGIGDLSKDISQSISDLLKNNTPIREEDRVTLSTMISDVDKFFDDLGPDATDLYQKKDMDKNLIQGLPLINDVITPLREQQAKIDLHDNLIERLNADIDQISTFMDIKSPYKTAKDLYDNVITDIENAKRYYSVGNKVINRIDNSYRSADDIPVSDELYAKMTKALDEVNKRLIPVEARLSELAGSKDALTRTYKVEEMKLRLQQWQQQISTYKLTDNSGKEIDSFAKIFGEDASLINNMIKRLNDILTQKGAWIEAGKIKDELINEGNMVLTMLSDIFYKHRNDIFSNKKFLEYIVSQFDFGNYGIGGMNGKNIVSDNVMDEPINLFKAGDFKSDAFEDIQNVNIPGDSYKKFISMYLFNNFIAMSGCNMSAAIKQYQEIETAADYSKDITPSSFEQYTMEIQAVMLAFAHKDGFAKTMIDEYKKQFAERNKASKSNINDAKLDLSIENYFNFTGFGGSGKTKNSVGKIIRLYAFMAGKSGDLKIACSAYSNKTTNQIKNEISKTGYNVSGVKFQNIKDIDVDADVIIIDEATLFNKQRMAEFSDKIKVAKNKPLIIALSDNTQMKSGHAGSGYTSFYGLTMNPLMNIYRTNVPAIIQMSEYYRRNLSANKPSNLEVPKLSYKELDNGKLIGGRYVSSESEVFSLAKDRIGKDIAVIVKDVNQKETAIKNGIPNDKIFIITSDENLAEDSIQGLEVDEVYIAFNPDTLDNYEKGMVGYTAVSRPKNFFAIVGPVNDINGNPNNIAPTGFMGTESQGLTKDEKEESRKRLLNHLENSYDKDNSGFTIATESKKEPAKPESKQNSSRPSPTTKKQKTSTKSKDVVDVNNEPLAEGNLVVTPEGNVTTIDEINGSNVIVGGQSFEGNNLTKFEPSLQDDATIDSYENASTTNPQDEQPGDVIEDITNPKDKQRYPDRNKQTYFSVNHIAYAPELDTISQEMFDDLSEMARTIRIINYDTAINEVKKTPTFEFENRITTVWDPSQRKMVKTTQNVLTMKMTKQTAQILINKYLISKGIHLQEDAMSVLTDMVVNFFVVPRDNNAAKNLYEKLESNAVSVTTLKIKDSILSLPPAIYRDIEKINAEDPSNYAHLPTSRQMKEEFERLGYRVTYVWKKTVNGETNSQKSGKAIAYMRVAIPGSTIYRDIKLTAFTVNEYAIRNDLNNVSMPIDYMSMMLNEIKAIEDLVAKPNGLAEANQKWANSKVFNFLSKNGFVTGLLPQIGDIKKFLDDARTNIESEIGDMFIAYNNENVELISRPASRYALKIGNPRTFVEFDYEDKSKKPGAKTTGKRRVTLDKNELSKYTKGTQSMEEAKAELARIIGPELTDMMLKSIPYDSDYYNELKSIVGSFTGVFSGNAIGLVTRDGMTGISTPRHEAVHFVMKYYIDPKIKSQMYREAKIRMAELQGKSIEDYTDNQAEEYIARMFGDTYNQKNETWYSKIPILRRFIEAMKQIFAKLGLYSYRISDLVNAMDSGYFSNGNPTLEGDEMLFEQDEDAPILENANIRTLKDAVGEPFYAVMKSMFSEGVVNNNIIGLSDSEVVSFTDSINLMREEWANDYPELNIDSELETIYGEKFTMREVIEDKRTDMALQVDDEVRAAMIAALFTDNDIVDILAEDAIPEYIGDLSMATSNISGNNNKNPQDLAKGLLGLAVNSIRPDGEDTPKLRYSELLSDFYNKIISGRNVRPQSMFDIIEEMKKAVETASKDREPVKNINRFISYYDQLIEKRNRLSVSKQIAIDEFLNAVASNLLSQNISPMATAYAVTSDNELTRIKFIVSHFNSKSGFTNEIKNKWGDAIMQAGEIRQPARKKVKHAGETQVKDTMFYVNSDGITFTDGVENKNEHYKFIETTKDGIKFTNDFIAKISISDPKAIKTINAIYDFLGLNYIFSTSMLTDLIAKHHDDTLNSVYSDITTRGENKIGSFMSNQIAYMMASTIAYDKAIAISELAQNEKTTDKVQYSADEKIKAINEFKVALSGYALGEVPFSVVTNTTYIQNKTKTPSQLFKDMEIPKGIITTLTKYFDVYDFRKIAPGVDASNNPEENLQAELNNPLRLLRPTDNFIFADVLATIGWEYRTSNVDNRIVMAGGGTKNALGIVSSLNMVKERHAQNTELSNKTNTNLMDVEIDGQKRKLSIFDQDGDDTKIIEINGYKDKNFGTNDIATSDLVNIHLHTFSEGIKAGNFIIPLSTFADSGRNFVLQRSIGNKETTAITMYENQILKAITHYEVATKRWVDLYNGFLTNPEIMKSIATTRTPLNYEDYIGDNLSKETIKRFVETIDSFEEELFADKSETGRKIYFEYSRMLEASELEDISGKVAESNVAFYQDQTGAFVDTMGVDDTIMYMPVYRYKVGKAAKFNIDYPSSSILSGNRMFQYMDKFGLSAISDIKEYELPNGDKRTNYDFIHWSVYNATKRAWNDIVKEYGTSVPESMISKPDSNIPFTSEFQDFILFTSLFGEEFMSTFAHGNESVDSPENMSKYLKTLLTPATRPATSIPLGSNLRVMYIADNFGKTFLGKIANLMDGGSFVSSFAKNIMNHSLGGKFAALKSQSDKPISVAMNSTKGEHKIVKDSTFAATDSIMENCPELRMLEIAMLRETTIPKYNLGDKYEEMWNNGFKHSYIIETLTQDYLEYAYKNGGVTDPNANIVWKAVPKANVKRGASRLNLAHISEIYERSKIRGANIISKLDPMDIGFIYNPEIEISETSKTKKTIQKTSICSWIDLDGSGNVRTKDTLNDIVSKMNEVSLREFEREMKVDLSVFRYGTAEMKQIEAKKIEEVAKKMARSGLEGQGSAGVLAQMISELSMNTPNVYESVMQVFVNQFSNKYGHRRSVAGDRMIQMWGHTFRTFIEPETGMKYNLSELNYIENKKKNTSGIRYDENYFVSKGYISRPLGYMKHDGKSVSRGEVALTFKYFDFFGLKSGEQPMHLSTIWKNDGSKIDLRDPRTFPEIIMKDDIGESIYSWKDGKYYLKKDDAAEVEISEKEYLLNLGGYIQSNIDEFDTENTVLFRETKANFLHKITMARESLLVQMDRVPYSTPGFTTCSVITTFINDEVIGINGKKRYQMPNTVFINMRDADRDGGDNDGDTKTVAYKNIVRTKIDDEVAKGVGFDVMYSFDSAANASDNNFERLANLYLDRIDAIILNPANIDKVFNSTTTSDMTDFLKNKIKSKKGKRMLSDYDSIIDLYESNKNDSSSIGNFANSSNVFAELITIMRQGITVYNGPMVKTIEEIVNAFEVFSKTLNAATDGVKKSILGPMNIITEFSNLHSYFIMAGKIPGFLIGNSQEEYLEYCPKNENGDGNNWENVYEFFNSKLMRKLSKQVSAGRNLFESSFADNIFFSVTNLKKKIANTARFTHIENIVGKIDYTEFNIDMYNSLVAEYDKLPDNSDNRKLRGQYQYIMNQLKDLRILSELERILPYSESIFGMSQTNSLRQKVLSKGFERESFIHQMSLNMGGVIDKNLSKEQVSKSIMDLFFENDVLVSPTEFEKRYNEKFGNSYAEIATDYYINNAPEFSIMDNGRVVLRKEEIAVHTDSYKEYIKNKFNAANNVKYAYALRYGAEYLKNLVTQELIGKSMSFLEREVIPEFAKMFFEDDRINTYSYRSQPQKLRDEIHIANINYAFEYRPKMSNLLFSYSFNPDGINSSTETISWIDDSSDKRNVIDLEIQRDRNRFLQSFPHLVMNLIELMTNPTNNPTAAIKKLLDIEDNAEANEAWNAIKENRFLARVSRGGGSTPALQYATRSQLKGNDGAIINERMDFYRLPESLQKMFAVYNLLHYGYRQSRSFLEILGESNPYYQEVDKFVSEDVRNWKENDPNMFAKYLRRTLDIVYASKELISAGKNMAGRDIHKRSYLYKTTIAPEGIKVRAGNKINVTYFRDYETNDYRSHFLAMPTIGAEYSLKEQEAAAESELFAITLQASMRDVNELLNKGQVTIPNRISTFMSKGADGKNIIYVVQGYTCEAVDSGNGYITLKRIDENFRYSLHAMQISGTDVMSAKQLDEYKKYREVKGENAANIKISKYRGQLPSFPQDMGPDTIVAHDAPNDPDKQGIDNGYQFDREDNDEFTARLRTSSNASGRGWYLTDELEDNTIAENEVIAERNNEIKEKIFKAITDFKIALLNARNAGKTIVFPEKGIGSSLHFSKGEWFHEQYNELSQWLLDEFGYFNPFYKVEKQSNGIQENIVEKIEKSQTVRDSLRKFVETNGETISEPIEEMITELMESFSAEDYANDTYEARLKSAVKIIKNKLFDFAAKMKESHRIDKQVKKCN